MKKMMIATAALAAALSSLPASAHVGEHGSLGLMAGTLHLLTEHGYLLALFGVVAGAWVLKRTLRG